jgi:hypothetical protein
MTRVKAVPEGMHTVTPHLYLCALMRSFYQSETNAARFVYCCASP